MSIVINTRTLFKLALFVALLWPRVVLAQNTISPTGPNNIITATSSACASAGQCVTFALPRATAIAFQVSGTYSGTLTFQATADGTNWVSLFVSNAATGAQATTTTSTGVFTVSNPGFQFVRVVGTSIASGGATIILTQGYGMAIKSSPAFPGSFTAGDLLYADSATTISGIADVATGQVLASGGVGVVPAYTAAPVVSTGFGVGTGTPDATHPFYSQTSSTGTPTFILENTNTTTGQSQLVMKSGTIQSYIGASNVNAAAGFAGAGRSWLDSTVGSGWDYSASAASAVHRWGTAGYAASNIRMTLDANGLVMSNVPQIVTAGTDDTTAITGLFTQTLYKATITPASGGAGNCATQAAGFKAASANADCVIATLKAGQRLVAAYADVTVGFTCSATCSGTKVFRMGISAGGTEVFATSLSVAAPATFGLADADMGSGMTRAAQIQGAYTPSWASTTTLTARFTSGTGFWGDASATFVNAGSITFYLITEQVK